MNTAPDRDEIQRDLAAILEARLGLAGLGSLEHETRFFADLGLASIDAVVLGEAIQEHYDRAIPFNLMMADIGSRSERDFAIGELVDFLHIQLAKSGER